MDVEVALRRNRTFQSTRSLDPLLSRAHAVAKLPDEPESRSQELAATLSEMRSTCTALAASIATKRTQTVEAHEASTAETEEKLGAMFRERVGRARVEADQRIEDLDRRFAEEARSVLQPTLAGTQAPDSGSGTVGAGNSGGEATGEGGDAGDGVGAEAPDTAAAEASAEPEKGDSEVAAAAAQ